MSNKNILQTPIEYLEGISAEKGVIMRKELGISDFEDLLYFFPYRYVDKTRYYKLNEFHNFKTEIQAIGRITQIKELGNGRSKRLTASFYDDTTSIELIWFKGISWMKKYLREGQVYVIFGKPSNFRGKINISHPEMELYQEHKKKQNIKVIPIYHSSEKLNKRGITSKFILKCMISLFSKLQGYEFRETLSTSIISKYNFPNKKESIFNIHFPQSNNILTSSINRFKFEELFFLQLSLLIKKLIRSSTQKSFIFDRVGENFNNFYKYNLPFELTNAQKRVIKEIRQNVSKGIQMNRLIQGDVGSGKTIIALMSMLIAIDNGFQACMIAPTEILAQQHFESVKELLKGMGIQTAILTGSSKTTDRKIIHNGLESGQINILIGTHAVLEDKVKFKNLGLGIIDEQHRFGVEQRSKLWKKNKLAPHILVMTATPIPRTLAMSLYGDLDISTIGELPKGRKQIKTLHFRESSRLKLFHFIKMEIEKGRQIYIVYPLIEESEAFDYKNITDGFNAISDYFPMPKYQISIVHGKMKQKDKDYEMERFLKKETQIMVATTVIEVGVNIPNASVMVIENSEKFGLSQLHQLRGRVGRGSEQSYCILMTGDKITANGRTRIKTMCDTNDGFKISEIDLKLRGAGDITGTQQSGILNLKMADIVKDQQTLVLARNEAIELLKDDPKLSNPQNVCIKEEYINQHKNKLNWDSIS